MFSSHPGRAIALRLPVHLCSLTWINNITSAANPVSSVNPLCHGGVNILFSASLCLCIITTWQRVIYNLRGGSLTTCGSRSQNSSFPSVDMFVLSLSFFFFFHNLCPVRSRGVSLNGSKQLQRQHYSIISPPKNKFDWVKHQQCYDVCHHVKKRHVSVLPSKHILNVKHMWINIYIYLYMSVCVYVCVIFPIICFIVCFILLTNTAIHTFFLFISL